MEALLLTFTAGWASGVNAYLAAALLGFCGKVGADVVPEFLQRTDVLIILSVLAVIEIVADKIPYVDSLWDAIQTPLRIAAGSVLGYLIAGHQVDAETIASEALMAVGGVTALVSHLAKSSIKLAVNSSPEPASNILVSATGDFLVASFIVLAVIAPIAAAVLAGVTLLVTILLAAILFKVVKRGWKNVKKRREEKKKAAVR